MAGRRSGFMDPQGHSGIIAYEQAVRVLHLIINYQSFHLDSIMADLKQLKAEIIFPHVGRT